MSQATEETFESIDIAGGRVVMPAMNISDEQRTILFADKCDGLVDLAPVAIRPKLAELDERQRIDIVGRRRVIDPVMSRWPGNAA